MKRRADEHPDDPGGTYQELDILTNDDVDIIDGARKGDERQTAEHRAQLVLTGLPDAERYPATSAGGGLRKGRVTQ